MGARSEAALTVAVLTAAALALGGCTPDRPAATGTSPSPAAGAATPAPSAQPVEPLVAFRRTGGFAGVDDRFAVDSAGGYSLRTKDGAARSGQLRAEELAELRRVLAAARLGGVPQPSVSAQVADGFAYELAAGGRVLRVADGGVPEAVEPVLATVTALIGEYDR